MDRRKPRNHLLLNSLIKRWECWEGEIHVLQLIYPDPNTKHGTQNTEGEQANTCVLIDSESLPPSTDSAGRDKALDQVLNADLKHSHSLDVITAAAVILATQPSGYATVFPGGCCCQQSTVLYSTAAPPAPPTPCCRGRSRTGSPPRPSKTRLRPSHRTPAHQSQFVIHLNVNCLRA